MFEWQHHSQSLTDIPHYEDLLKFLDLGVQTPKSVCDPSRKSTKPEQLTPHVSKDHLGKRVPSHAATNAASMNCVVCKSEKYPLYACSKVKSLGHDDMMSTIKSNSLCVNCLHPGRHAKDCKSCHHCRHWQRPHHTLLHFKPKGSISSH